MFYCRKCGMRFDGLKTGYLCPLCNRACAWEDLERYDEGTWSLQLGIGLVVTLVFLLLMATAIVTWGN